MIVGVISSAILAFPYLKVVVLLWLNEPAPDAPTVNLPSPMAGTVVAAGVPPRSSSASRPASSSTSSTRPAPS